MVKKKMEYEHAILYWWTLTNMYLHRVECHLSEHLNTCTPEICTVCTVKSLLSEHLNTCKYVCTVECLLSEYIKQF